MNFNYLAKEEKLATFRIKPNRMSLRYPQTPSDLSAEAHAKLFSGATPALLKAGNESKLSNDEHSCAKPSVVKACSNNYRQLLRIQCPKLGLKITKPASKFVGSNVPQCENGRVAMLSRRHH
ncbi:hypothetical protein N8510_00310 [bacterium]|nr:hypothetical protein [Rubripirellula sp.]MDA7492519.1 hypothetical protein [bacterium]MDB4654541.1 hypothetical protein [Rubripirellula sp.]